MDRNKHFVMCQINLLASGKNMKEHISSDLNKDKMVSCYKSIITIFPSGKGVSVTREVSTH